MPTPAKTDRQVQLASPAGYDKENCPPGGRGATSKKAGITPKRRVLAVLQDRNPAQLAVPRGLSARGSLAMGAAKPARKSRALAMR